MLYIQNIRLIIFLIYFLGAATLVIAFLYNINNEYPWYLLKDVPILCAIGVSVFLFRGHIYTRPLTLTTPLAILLIYSFIVSDAHFFTKIASCRQILVPFIFLYIGYIYTTRYRHTKLLENSILNTTILIVSFGYIERLTHLWHHVSITTFFDMKNIPTYDFGYPVYWIEPISLFGFREFDVGIIRMVSSIFDPINLGHIIVLSLAIIFCSHRISLTIQKKLILSFFLLPALALTFSKGAWLQLILLIVAFNIKKRPLISIILTAISIPIVILYITKHPGFLNHYNGLINTLDNISFFGLGLGKAGNYSVMFNSDSINTQKIVDTFLGGIIGQVGIIGFIMWIIPFLYFSARIKYSHFINIVLFSQLAISALSENTFNFMSIAYLMILYGSYVNAQLMQPNKMGSSPNQVGVGVIPTREKDL